MTVFHSSPYRRQSLTFTKSLTVQQLQFLSILFSSKSWTIFGMWRVIWQPTVWTIHSLRTLVTQNHYLRLIFSYVCIFITVCCTNLFVTLHSHARIHLAHSIHGRNRAYGICCTSVLNYLRHRKRMKNEHNKLTKSKQIIT